MGISYAREKLFHSIDCKNKKDVDYILTKYPSLACEFFDQSQTSLPMTRASWLGANNIIETLLNFGADINQKTSTGQTAIFFAAQKGRKETIELLISRNCQLEMADNLGSTPLDFAIMNGYFNIALLLFKKVRLSGIVFEKCRFLRTGKNQVRRQQN